MFGRTMMDGPLRMVSRPSPQRPGRDAYVKRTVPSRTRSICRASDCATTVDGASVRSKVIPRSDMGSPIDEVEKEFLHAWILALAEPEDGLLPQIAIGIV